MKKFLSLSFYIKLLINKQIELSGVTQRLLITATLATC